jgi:hypothetical protein
MKGDWIGWLATMVFMTSYLSKNPAMLRRLQGFASCLWLTHGIVIRSVPVIVANFLVAVVAFYSSFRTAKSNRPV